SALLSPDRLSLLVGPRLPVRTPVAPRKGGGARVQTFDAIPIPASPCLAHGTRPSFSHTRAGGGSVSHYESRSCTVGRRKKSASSGGGGLRPFYLVLAAVAAVGIAALAYAVAGGGGGAVLEPVAVEGLDD